MRPTWSGVLQGNPHLCGGGEANRGAAGWYYVAA